MQNNIIKIATDELGYIEKKSNSNLDSKTANAGTKDYTKYGKWYKSNPGPWCVKFVCWVFNSANCLNLIKKTASSTTLMRWFKSKKQFESRNRFPKPASIIFINWERGSSPHHVGIVYKSDSTYVYTIEGNRTNAVKKAKYKLTDTRIIGYGNPRYTTNVPSPTVTPPKYTIGEYTVISKTYLRVRAGPSTSYRIKSYNELTPNAKSQILKLNNNKTKKGLVYGVECDVSEIKNNNWGKIPSGWICLDYCKKN